jgi:predicted transcriptional regulator
MKTSITLELDTDLLRKLRVLAAEEDTSISALLVTRIEQIVREHKTYDRARKRALARLREGINLGWKNPRSRDELHERYLSEQLAFHSLVQYT